MAARCEPVLQQGGGRGERDERQADRCGEQAQQPEFEPSLRRSFEAVSNADRQRRGGNCQKAKMDEGRETRRQHAAEQVRVGVAQQQCRLEEHHCDRPDRGRAAEPRQHHLREHRLDREQQQRREEERRGIYQGRETHGPR